MKCSGVRRKSRSYVFVTRRRSNRAGLIMRLLITGTQSAIYDFRGGYTRKIVFQNDLHNFHNSPWLEHAIFRWPRSLKLTISLCIYDIILRVSLPSPFRCWLHELVALRCCLQHADSAESIAVAGQRFCKKCENFWKRAVLKAKKPGEGTIPFFASALRGLCCQFQIGSVVIIVNWQNLVN